MSRSRRNAKRRRQKWIARNGSGRKGMGFLYNMLKVRGPRLRRAVRENERRVGTLRAQLEMTP